MGPLKMSTFSVQRNVKGLGIRVLKHEMSGLG